MRSKALVYATAILAVAMFVNLSVMPAIAKPGEITIIVKDYFSKDPQPSGVVFLLDPNEPAPGTVDSTPYPVVDGKVLIDNSAGTIVAGTRLKVWFAYTVEGWRQAGDIIKISHSLSARTTILVVPDYI